MEHPAITAWLDEIEMYGLRRERVPDGAMPWIIEAFLRGQDAEREACAKIATDRAAVCQSAYDAGDRSEVHPLNEALHIAQLIRNRT